MRSSADPVRALLRRHRLLCQRAVDPLEIAAALEADGLTDRAAARFRHRDVFSLAEELYARAPRVEFESEAELGGRGRAEPGWARVPQLLPPLLPGALCAVAVAAWEPGAGALRGTVAAACAALAVATAGLVLALGRLSTRRAAALGGAGLAACAPVGFALWGEALLGAMLPGADADAGTEAGGGAEPDAVVALGLALAVAPAAWCGRWFAARARRRLAASRGLREFAAGARRLLAAALARYAAGLAAALLLARLLAPTGSVTLAATAALGLLLFAAALLAAHGRTRAAATGLAAAGAAEFLTLATASAAWLPGCAALGRPVTALAGEHGPAAVPLLACGLAALGLLGHAARVLARASAHGPEQPDQRDRPDQPPRPGAGSAHRPGAL
ncbi:hypothetical protein [Streptomyces sp. 6N223]|uniref:hypothetical protein n=1 Tax=Streptomyces sp. 6N223 TaxID=3457412 RepID=UPI003FD2986A